MNPAQTLISFARNRKKAYRAYGQMNPEREKAAAEIIRVSQFFLNTGKAGWVGQLRNSIEILIPDPDSPEAHWREKINQFINLNNNVTT